MSGGTVGEERLGRRSEVEANALGNLPFSVWVEVDMSEADNRVEFGQAERTRLDLFEVAVVAKRLHGVANSRIDGAMGPLGHRDGNVESLEEQRRHPDGRPACEGTQVRVGAKAAAGQVDGFHLGAQKRSASSTSAGAVTMRVAVVPKARNDRSVVQACTTVDTEVLIAWSPEVTTGRVVVVVGGEVVVVVGGAVVVGDVATEDEPWSDELGVVVGGDVTVVEVLGDVVVGTCAGAAFDAWRRGALWPPRRR